MSDYAEIHAPEGLYTETATLLLSLARDPRDVRTRGGKTVFLVPDYLASEYVKATQPKPRRKRAPQNEEGESQ